MFHSERISSGARIMGAVRTPRVGCEFDNFLRASVGDDANGMALMVLSALARMDVDPWEEAAKLMQLPKDGAIKQLACLLGALKKGVRRKPRSPTYRCPISRTLAAVSRSYPFPTQSLCARYTSKVPRDCFDPAVR